jgi:hypothetical protein
MRKACAMLKASKRGIFPNVCVQGGVIVSLLVTLHAIRHVEYSNEVRAFVATKTGCELRHE